MLNFYFFQVNYSYGNTYHLPYTAATLSAYVFEDSVISENFCFKDIFFRRDNTDMIMEKIENPAVAAFSTYIWNFEYNKLMASKIKAKYPDCKIIFGGHNVAPGDSLTKECPYIDFLIHGEGEIGLKKILLSMIGKEDVTKINGISYRDGEHIITNYEHHCPEEAYIDYPSPYLKGYFDKILEENKGVTFMSLIETTRGCPHSCAYCDWSNLKSKMRKFPMDKIKAEIKWVSDHKLIGLGSADSNFGIFARDEEIVDYMIKLKEETGYPQRFQTSYAKNSNERIFRMGKKLDDCGMSKGVTLSFQSMSDEVLDIIGRKNIPVSSYKELMKMYNEAGVSTYTELILGLPGETYDSFAEGIDTLLNLGQHNSLYIHNCECLVCSVLGRPEYMEKYKIGVSKLLLNQPHIEPVPEEVNEYSQLITSTFSMTNDDWIKMNLFSFTVQCFHFFGLTQLIALWLHNEKNVGYRDFYEKILKASENEKEFPLLYKLYSAVINHMKDIISLNPGAAFTCSDERFGPVQWSFEEFIFLGAVYEFEELYNEIDKITASFNIDKEFYDELMYFQRQMVKRPFENEKHLELNYDFLNYFKEAVKNNRTELKKVKNVLDISVRGFDNWNIYAKTIVWFGRKDGKSIYLNDCRQTFI